MSERDGLARSVQVRLAQHAKAIGVDPNLVLTRYAVERLLYRLTRSAHADRFVLKGALLMLAWFGDTLRPTRDADLLGFGDLSQDTLRRIFADVCSTEVEVDAITYITDTIRVEPIRFEDSYGGQRVTLIAVLGAAQLRVQVDVGIGDAVVPEPTWIDYPSLLDFPHPRLRAYSPATVVAEKLHAIVALGLRNSRMKDYFDLLALARDKRIDQKILADAIVATFKRRQTRVPDALPIGLAPAFAEDAAKKTQWSAFVTRNRLEAPALDVAVTQLRDFLSPALAAANAIPAKKP
ncbi:MAG: nucleotidyl transferase AbiEii/AbiGii toxin family protein [Candidatus Obscuribacterales bacterium]|nr:nucleotidyl transferase AbiEii/AbiGii toxin family protein [Steroidobacteraceae bacterium]